MPRQPRYYLPGIPQHVITKGVDRQATFFSEEDYALFKQALVRNANRYGAAIHAYVLMTNHVHLLLTPQGKRSIAQILQGLGRDFVQRINRQYGRTGTLWQSRYKASLVQDDLYLLQCQRYIELNPVRAGMVADPANYPYSSYRHNAFGDDDAVVSPHPVYQNLAQDDSERHQRYRDLFQEALDRQVLNNIRRTTNACLVLGNDAFKDQIEAMLKRRVRPAKIGRPRKKTSA